MPVKIGDKAPNFTLRQKTAEGLKDHSLNSYQGKQNVVLLFFPLANTSICTNEMCEVSKGLDEYAKLNAAAFGISVDSPFAQEGWAQREKITIPLLSDFNKEVCAAYGCKHEDLLGFKGVAKRSAFVIDKKGIVQHAFISDDPKVLPNFADIKGTLARLA